MKIAFTDIDGVLNGTSFWAEEKRHECNKVFPIDPDILRMYVFMLNDLQLDVVFSSAWRMMPNWRDFGNILTSFGFNGKFLGRTPRLNKPRGLEIADFLSTKEDVEDFIIFDDNDDMDPYMNKLIQTDPVVGFSPEDMEKAKTLILSKK